MKSPLFILGALVVCVAPFSNAATTYWDINGSTTGGSNGTTADGIWSTSDANWSANANGTVATAVWLAGDNAVFSAGTNVTGASTVTVSGAQTLGTLTIQEGAVTFAGDALSLTGTALTVAAGTSATFNNNLQLSAQVSLTGNVTLNGILSHTLTTGRLLNIGTALVNIAGTGGIDASNGTSGASIVIGNGAAQGGVVQTGTSTVNLGAGNLYMGNTSEGSHGAYNLAGGTLSGAQLIMGSANANTTANLVTATYAQTAGSATFTRVLVGHSTNASAASTMTLNGGTFTFNGTNSASNIFSVGGSGRGELNVGGSGVLDFSGAAGIGRILYLGESATATGIVNLSTGGTIKTYQVAERNASASTTFNFNGGTLQATLANTTFIAVDNAYVYSGGARIDSAGFNLTVAQSLQAPTGNGVSAVAVTAGGSGYTGAPVVSITGGGGTGATGYAVMDSTGTQVVSIVITNAGTGYTSAPTVTLVGGGGTGAVLGTASLAANASGALTKLGAGILTLSAANTYAGGTFVNAGGIATTGVGTLGTGNVTVATGATLTLGNAASIADNALLFFSAGSSITLTSGTETLGNIVFGGTGIVAAGLYSASDLNTYFGLTGGDQVFLGAGLYNIAASPIPEPLTVSALAGAIALGAAVVVRRRRAGR